MYTFNYPNKERTWPACIFTLHGKLRESHLPSRETPFHTGSTIHCKCAILSQHVFNHQTILRFNMPTLKTLFITWKIIQCSYLIRCPFRVNPPAMSHILIFALCKFSPHDIYHTHSIWMNANAQRADKHRREAFHCFPPLFGFYSWFPPDRRHFFKGQFSLL